MVQVENAGCRKEGWGVPITRLWQRLSTDARTERCRAMGSADTSPLRVRDRDQCGTSGGRSLVNIDSNGGGRTASTTDGERERDGAGRARASVQDGDGASEVSKERKRMVGCWHNEWMTLRGAEDAAARRLSILH